VSGDPIFDALKADAMANAGQPAGDPAIAIDRERLLGTMGIQASLGADADVILGLAAASEDAARQKQPLPNPPVAPTSEVQGGSIVEAVAVLAAFKRVPSPYPEFREQMAGYLDSIGRAGAPTLHADLGTDSVKESEGSLTGTSQVRTTVDVTIAASDVKVTIDRDIQTTVTDTATGYTRLTESVRHEITGDLDACPSAAGLVPASLDVSLADEASTFAAPGGGVASHATASSTRSSQFQGTVDDQATLGAVSQTFTQDESFKRTTTAEDGSEETKEGAFTAGVSGINDGVPADGGFGATIGDWSGSTPTGKDKSSGDVTPEMTGHLDTDAGSDYATMEQAYRMAQTLWRDSRCVIVTSPTYIPRKQFDFNGRPTHTEEVDKGSTTQFQVGIDHRFGQAVSAKITTELDGKDTLSPDLVETPPGALTYTAPDEDGQDANVLLESTSRQGIGKLKLTFHTGGKKFKVSIDGKMTTSLGGVSYTTTLHVPDLLLSRTADPPVKSKDGLTETLTYEGTGPATAKILLGIADCRQPWTDKGPFKVIAKHEVTEDGTLDGKWTLDWDSTGTFTATGGACAGLTLDSFFGTGDAGPVGGFTYVLGPVDIRSPGDSVRVRHTTNLGGSKNAIDATVTGKVVTDSGK